MRTSVFVRTSLAIASKYKTRHCLRRLHLALAMVLADRCASRANRLAGGNYECLSRLSSSIPHRLVDKKKETTVRDPVSRPVVLMVGTRRRCRRRHRSEVKRSNGKVYREGEIARISFADPFRRGVPRYLHVQTRLIAICIPRAYIVMKCCTRIRARNDAFPRFAGERRRRFGCAVTR